MRLVRYGEAGQERPGLLGEDGGLRDLSAVVEDIAGPALAPEGLAAIAAAAEAGLPAVEGEPRLGPCVGAVGKIVCIGLNYADHAAESGMPVPSEPIVFMKATSSICGPFDDLVIPAGAESVDWEVELGIVIGQRARRVSEAEALEHVAGYCVVNDVSERDWQLKLGGQWTKGKSADTFGPLGPWLVTRDAVPNPQDLRLWCTVDGERRQDGSTKTMVFGVTTLVSYVSRFMTLEPGDVIMTGTPPGVGLGMKPPVFLRAGQEIRTGVEGLGEQRQRVVAG